MLILSPEIYRLSKDSLEPGSRYAIDAPPTNRLFNDYSNGVIAADGTLDLIFVAGYGWLSWTGTHWSSDGAETLARHYVSESLRSRHCAAIDLDDKVQAKATMPSATRTKAALWFMENLKAARLAGPESVGHLLNCRNGTIDLRTSTLQRHNRNDTFTWEIGLDYDPAALDSPAAKYWVELLHGWLGSSEQVAYLQRAIGYSITGETKEEVFFILQGPGRSGKTTIVSTIATILGAPLARATSFSTFCDYERDSKRFSMAAFRASRFVMASEASRRTRFNESTIKLVTGREPIEAAFKGRDAFTYWPSFKIWLTTNFVPRADVNDDAFWSRCRIIQTKQSFIGKEDKDLKDRLLAPASQQAILAWAVAGARDWYLNGLGTSIEVSDATEGARLEMDNVADWMNACCELGDPNEFSATDIELYSSYINYLENEGLEKERQDRNEFLRSVFRRSAVSYGGRRSIRVAGKVMKTRNILGIALRNRVGA